MAIIVGTAGADVLIGSTLQDQAMMAGEGAATSNADASDNIKGNAGGDYIYGGDGDDIIYGGTGNDVISDGTGNDFVNAGEGDDLVITGYGDDVFAGGKGFDTIDFSGASQGLVADLSKNIVTGQGSDSVSGFEKFIGTAFGDSIKGSSEAEVIVAGEGENVIRGMGGSDTMSGGIDHDTFVWKAADVTPGSIDLIKGFEGNDTLDIRQMFVGLVNEDMTRQERMAAINDNVHMTETATGTILQVNMGGAFVDVAVLEGYQTYGASAGALASDGVILI
jgi:serralysin